MECFTVKSPNLTLTEAILNVHTTLKDNRNRLRDESTPVKSTLTNSTPAKSTPDQVNPYQINPRPKSTPDAIMPKSYHNNPKIVYFFCDFFILLYDFYVCIDQWD